MMDNNTTFSDNKPLMTEEEFEQYLRNNLYNSDGTQKLRLRNFEAVKKYKSVGRAFRRGLVSSNGIIYPKRPFGNSKSKDNTIKREIYEQLKSRTK